MVANRDIHFHTLSADEALENLGSSAQGLSASEADLRLQKYGINALEETERIPLWKIALSQFRDPLIYILLAAAAVTAFLGEYTDTAVILVVVLVDAIIGFWQENKAARAISALKKMTSPTTLAIRDGIPVELDSSRLVPGDIVLLASGDRIPADLRLLEVNMLEVDESALTGESMAVRKTAGKLEQYDLPLGDRKNLAYMGTVVLSGRGRGVVFATGKSTEIGHISEKIRTVEEPPTPLEVQFARLGKLIGILILFLCALVFVMGFAAGLPASELLVSAIALAVAAIPEGLPVVFTLTLAVGVNRMARRNAIVRHLPAVETLGSCNIIASDKTGTLTRNQMTVREIFTGGEVFRITGTGYDPEGSILHPDSNQQVAAHGNQALYYCLLAGLLANESGLVRDENHEYQAQGDPTETALIVSAAKGGLDRDDMAKRYKRLAVIPFESENFYMATLHADRATGKKFIFVKGAPEKLLEMTRGYCLSADGSPVPFNKEEVLEQYRAMGTQGLRVLAMGFKEVPEQTMELEPSMAEEGLVLCGLQGMMDPPREEALEAVKKAQKAGIRILMITGDHQVTATAIARQLGIIKDEKAPAISGRDIDSLDDEELYDVLQNVSVFARVSPLNKLRIIEQLLRRGDIVAVTGDGVNDAPALKAAHIGVAMGKTGTDAAKETADIIVTDDNFASIYAAVEEGRVVFSNLRKATFFLLSTGAGTILATLLVLLLKLPIPFIPAQILWLNLVTNGLQDVAMAFEPGEKDAILGPPRKPHEPIVNLLMGQRLLLVGLLMMVGTVAVFSWQLNLGASLQQARSVALTTMVVFQMFHVFNCRSEEKSILGIPLLSNKFLFFSVISAMIAHLAALYLPPLQFVFRTTPLTLHQWLVIIPTAGSVILGMEVEKAIRRKKKTGTGTYG